jgi:integrase
MNKPRGLFQRDGAWWISYFADGKRHREKVGSKSAAIRLLTLRRAAVLERRKLPENLRRVVRVSDLASAMRSDYSEKGQKSYAWVERRWRLHLEPFFGGFAIDNVTTERVRTYIASRESEGASKASINRELAVLKRMYNLGRAATPPLIRFVPVMPRLKESKPRAGFVEDKQYRAMAENAGELWLRAILAIAYTFGFREGELLSLRVGQINLAERTIELEAEDTKNHEGRKVVMTPEVYALVCALVAGKRSNDFVFRREDGSPVRDFRGAWWALCEKSGQPGLLFHDLRRSAVRNMVRAGISEKVAMTISGHKTRSVFDRYNIIDNRDLREAAEKIEKRSATTSATEAQEPEAAEEGIANKYQYNQ